MSYQEVLNTPYQLLLMMQHDKIRVDYSNSGGEETQEVSGKEMLMRKGGRKENNSRESIDIN